MKARSIENTTQQKSNLNLPGTQVKSNKNDGAKTITIAFFRETLANRFMLSNAGSRSVVLADLQVYQRCIAECENRVEPELVRPCVRRCIAVVLVKTDCPVQPMQSLFYLGSGCVGVSTREVHLHCGLNSTAETYGLHRFKNTVLFGIQVLDGVSTQGMSLHCGLNSATVHVPIAGVRF